MRKTMNRVLEGTMNLVGGDKTTLSSQLEISDGCNKRQGELHEVLRRGFYIKV